jgi:hypothetical protein
LVGEFFFAVFGGNEDWVGKRLNRADGFDSFFD